MTPTGFELSVKSREKTAILEIGGATGGAVGGAVDVDLEQLASELKAVLSFEQCRQLADSLALQSE